MLKNIKNKIGDLWWYSAILFFASRSGDLIQAFIGIWLVPKFVGPKELGAIMPIQQLSGLLTVPITAVTIVFAKFVNSYATRGEYGKVKSFIRDTAISSVIIFLFCMATAYLILPQFYSRLNITSGALTILILASGFIGNISQLYTSALQGLKKFNILTAISFIGAPIRLITLIVFMPFRALSGFVLGQTTPAATSSIVAAFSIRREFYAVKTDTTWRQDIPAIVKYLIPICAFLAFTTLSGTIYNTIYRQRLPEIESAAYYMLSRLAEIANYVGTTMIVVLFPLASEAHEMKREKPSILRHTIFATAITTGLLAIIFAFSGHFIFSLSKIWSVYLPYSYLLPWTTIIFGTSSIIGSVISYEIACRRFCFAFSIAAFSLLTTFIMATFTGYEFFRGFLPNQIIDWISAHNLSSLSRMTWFALVSAGIQLTFLFIFLKNKLRHDN